MKIEYSQISPQYLKRLLAHRYNIPSTVEVIYLHQGINDTYKVITAGKEYVLRIYRSNWKPYDDISGELELLTLLGQKKIMVSLPIPDQEKNLIQKLMYPEGTRYFVLFSFAPGKKISSLGLESARLFGEHLAQVHNVTERSKINKLSKSYDLRSILSTSKSSLKSRLGEKHSLLKQLSQIEQTLEKKLNPNILEQLPQGICHGDPHYENCFMDIEKEELTFFDFDFCGNGYLHYDLGSFFRYERDKPEIKKSFLAGYTTIRPLDDIQLSLIPYFEILMRLFHLGARAINADGIKNPIWPTSEIEETIGEIGDQLRDISKKEA